MSSTLTEALVLRSFASLRDVRVVDIWGSKLVDISVVKKLPALEVLTLSDNALDDRALVDIACCGNLRELYLRKNNISRIESLGSIKGLANLTHLWLSENVSNELAA
jgi:Leucine-rich repeat (LRR) protein